MATESRTQQPLVGWASTSTRPGPAARRGRTFGRNSVLPMLLAIPLAFMAAGCGGSFVRSLRPTAQAGVLILPVDRISDLEPPFVVLVESRIPVYLHVSPEWDFDAVSTRCGDDCSTSYDGGSDQFECSCSDSPYRYDGMPFDRNSPPLPVYPVLFREEMILIDLAGILGERDGPE